MRKIGFDAGHRVVNHESKCRTLHGHRYTAEIHARSEDGLDELGRVVDFSVLKEKVGGWIDEHWDHAMIIFSEDPDLEHLKKCSGMKEVFVTNKNPTAENLASYLIREVCPIVLKDTGVIVEKIVLWETPNCSATATV